MDKNLDFFTDESSPMWLKINKAVLLVSDVLLAISAIIFAFVGAVEADDGWGFFVFNGMVLSSALVIFMGHAWWMLVFNVIHNIQAIKDKLSDKTTEDTLPEF